MAASRAAVGQTVATEKVPGPSNLPQIKPVLGVEIELLLEHTAPPGRQTQEQVVGS